ncbi:response regulator [Marinobacter bohaiensis]|uniref:response regulator n=1 Tax=Marinobacter bohaiensis TaxID=2201898 RepID=UPI000DACD6ED|nr:response regulator [Marinobacter bohaiensis]
MSRGQALIIDDSSTARIILARLLEKADLDTQGAASAEEGFRILQDDVFDLIFLDHLLPGLNGFEALARLKADPETADIPVFMYTSQNAEKYVEEAKARGAAGVISKQVDRKALMGMIDSILAGQEAEAPLLHEAIEHARDTADPVSGRRLTGRLATLEIAYEELHEELRQLRTGQATHRVQKDEANDRRFRRLRLLWLFSAIAFAVILLFYALQMAELQQVVANMNEQFVLIQEIVTDLAGLRGESE